MSEKQDRLRSKLWTFQIYPDNKKHMEILEYTKQNYKYAYILHNKDIYTEDEYNEKGELKHTKGELKKEHIHLLILLENARELKSIIEEFKIESNLIKKVNSKKYMIRYLTHIDFKEKAQYKVEDIKTNTENEIQKAYRNESENEQIKAIINFIYSKKRFLLMTEVTNYAIENDYYSCLRRGIGIVSRILNEHNGMIK